MSKKELMAACTLIGAGLSQSAYSQDLTDSSEVSDDLVLYEEATYFAPFAAAMVEAAHGVTFRYPENYQYSVYFIFGDHLGDETVMADEDDNADGYHLLPDRENAMQQLKQRVFDTFVAAASPTQHESLRAAIHQAYEELA